MRKNVALFIYNPRVFKLVANLIKEYDLNVYVPDNIQDVRLCDMLIVDSEGLSVLKNILHGNHVPRHHVVFDEFSVYTSILSIFNIDKVGAVQIGIDVGRQLAYVILCDDFLLKAGYVSSFRELVSFVKLLESYLKPTKVILKIGGRISTSMLYSELVRSLPPDYELYIVDEKNSSSRTRLNLRGLKKRFTRDLHAALNIALREGIRFASIRAGSNHVSYTS